MSRRAPIHTCTTICDPTKHINKKVEGLRARTHLVSFSSRSASRPSPSSPSDPYGVGSVSSRTSTGSRPCARKAHSVRGAVSVDAGSATIDACEFGCTGASVCCESPPPCTLTPEGEGVPVAVVATGVETEGVRRMLRRNAALRRTLMSESDAHNCMGVW